VNLLLSQARNLVQWLLDKDIADRPTLLQVLNHKWLAEDVFDPFQEMKQE
jgi:hypothetical protein